MTTLDSKYDSTVRTRLRHHISRLRAIKADYAADVDAWYTTGEGQNPNWVEEWDEDLQDVIRYNAGGKGYTFPHCIHGASRWTDYDNICGGCEDGYLTSGSVARFALDDAIGDVVTFRDRLDWYMTGQRLGAELPDIAWVCETIS
jgi:hypothetical protein